MEIYATCPTRKQQSDSHQMVIWPKTSYSPLSESTLNCTFHFLFKFATGATQSQEAENRVDTKLPSLTAGKDKFKDQLV